MLSAKDLPALSISPSNLKWYKISYPIHFLPLKEFKRIINDFDSTVFSTGILSSNIIVLKELFRIPITGILFATNSSVRWESCGRLPDFIISEPSQLEKISSGIHQGYVAEAVAIKRVYHLSGLVRVIAITSRLQSKESGHEYCLVSGGRYFKLEDQRSKTNYIGAMVLKNKKSLIYQNDFNKIFHFLLKHGVKTRFDGITRVPPKIGDTKWDRFKQIVNNLCRDFNCIDYSDSLDSLPEIISQKKLSTSKRWENTKGKFVFKQNVDGEHIILLDDVITSGATTLSCADSIMECGASRVTIVTILINQFYDARLDSSLIIPKCPCGGDFSLRVNSTDGSFFYGCSNYPMCTNKLCLSDWNIKLDIKNEDS